MNTAENTADKVLHELQEITLQRIHGITMVSEIYWWVQENSARRDF